MLFAFPTNCIHVKLIHPALKQLLLINLRISRRIFTEKQFSQEFFSTKSFGWLDDIFCTIKDITSNSIIVSFDFWKLIAIILYHSFIFFNFNIKHILKSIHWLCLGANLCLFRLKCFNDFNNNDTLNKVTA